jgi:ribonuclease PH
VRADGRGPADLRPIEILPGFVTTAHGSALITMGRTRVICTASVDEGVPHWRRGQGLGWVTAEYGMLPGSTGDRKQREVNRGRPEGRTQEIQRLIGRALRAVTDLRGLGERTVWVDCDVLQADGGTRCAGITGGYVALHQALAALVERGRISELPLRDSVAAVSVGIVDGAPVLDLAYEEDSRAGVDMNVVMTGGGDLVEVQATAEGDPFPRADLDRMMELAEVGVRRLAAAQLQVTVAAARAAAGPA